MLRHLIDITDLTVDEVKEILDLADDMMANRAKYTDRLHGKILATLFFEPSTRTRLSFESAMLSLGGSVLGFSSPDNTSATKGETLSDTISVVSGYCDVIAMRHPKEGAPIVAVNKSSVPIINAGDGGHSHPTQTLTDLLTIRRAKGRLDHMTIGMCGDLKFGRTVHSLINAMSRYEGVKFVLISPPELKVPEYITRSLRDRGIPFTEVESMEEVMPQLDVLYMTRIQRERFDSLEVYERLKDSYILTPEKLVPAKESLSILHPLPRVNEISVRVDSDPRACYFQQALNGKYMRMALILMLLEQKDREMPQGEEIVAPELQCDNPRCITSTEQELTHVFRPVGNGTFRCIYCEREKTR